MPNQPKTPQRNIRIPDEVWRAAQDRAAREGTNVSDVVRRYLDRWETEVDVASRQALRWVIEHKSCTGFDQCWAAAPDHIRAEIVATWGEDPWGASS